MVGQIQRAGHMDVSNSVDVSDPKAVMGEVMQILGKRYPGFDFAPLPVLFGDFSRLYNGTYPGFRECDVRYHNAHHVLDVTLAMARLIDGHGRRHPTDDGLAPDEAMIGIGAALFHDSGYIRRTRDTRHKNGAAYTRVHVSRGIRFISDYFPRVGLQYMVDPCARILHFTGYEVDPRDLYVANEQEHVLGKLLGSADLIAQMADVAYVQKCRDFLFEEFAAGGMAGEETQVPYKGVLYRSPEQLMQQTPGFMRTAIEVRLDGHFDSMHQYAADHFDGQHLYMEAIQHNYSRLEAMLASSGD
ncbi:MAG: hypothetical protein OSA45_09590 [Halioglobus sp.]|nr:hypothetical protein [Halioglobus sp.]